MVTKTRMVCFESMASRVLYDVQEPASPNHTLRSRNLVDQCATLRCAMTCHSVSLPQYPKWKNISV
jgi:hypothetical protein